MPTRLPALGPDEARGVDRLTEEQHHVPFGLLLETAGRSVAGFVRRDSRPGKLVALLGKGGNGGIGMAASRHLALAGYDVSLALAAPPETLLPASWLGLQILKSMGARVVEGKEALDAIRDADFVLDALLGYNARGEPRPPMDALIAAANASSARRVSVDMPTGVDPAGGIAAKEPFRAHATVMIGFPKKGALHADARAFTGALAIADAGYPEALYAKAGGTRPAFDADGVLPFRA